LNLKKPFFYKLLNNRWTFVVSGFIVFVSLGTVYSYSLLRVEIQTKYLIGSTLSGLPYLTSLAFYALTMFLSGRMLSRYSPARVMFVGSTLVSLGWILSAYVPSLFGLVCTYGVIMGIGVGLVYGVPLHVIPKWFPKNRGIVLGFVLAGFGISPLLTSPITQLALDQYGLDKTFLVFGLIFGICLPLLSLLFHYPFDAVDNDNVITVKPITTSHDSNMLKTLKFWLLYINFIIGTTIGLMIIGISGTIGTVYYSLEIHQVVYAISFFALCNGLGRPLFGWSNDRIGTRNTIIIIYAITILSSVILIYNPFGNLGSFVVGFSLLWMTLGSWLAVAPAATLTMFGEKTYSRNYGIVFTGYGIGSIIGVISSGILLDANISISVIFITVVFISFLSLLTTSLLLKGALDKTI